MNFERTNAIGEVAVQVENDTLGQWCQENVVTLNDPDEYKADGWVKQTSVMTDYLVNPSYRKKNFFMINDLMETMIPHMQKNPKKLEELQKQIAENRKVLYDTSSVM